MKKIIIIGKIQFIFLIILLFTLFSFGNLIFFEQNFISYPNNGKELPFLRSSDSESPIFINGSGTGVGAHNWSWVEAQTWFDGGDGSQSYPYLIEEIEIVGSSTSTCFEIVDSNKWFTLSNCKFSFAGASPHAGLKMKNVNNCEIIDSDIYWCDGDGINLTSCNNINITNTEIRLNSGTGALFSNVQNVKLELNLFDRNSGDGIYIENSNDVTFIENYFEENTGYGCYFELVNDINLLHNEIVANNLEGLFLRLINNSYLLDNNVAYNHDSGLDIAGINNKIINNSFNYNLRDGVSCHWYSLIDSCHSNTFENNEMNGNYNSGIDVSLSNANDFFKNSMSNNRFVGLYLSNSDNNNVTNNIVNDNEGNWGILIDDSDDNIINENQVIGNKGTIGIAGSSSGNIIINNIYEILKNIFIDISEQIFSSDHFNLTFFLHDENSAGITANSIQMWWNGINVSVDVQTLGIGYYYISLEPLTILPDEDPILLNMTISASGYEDKYFETHIAIYPSDIAEDTLDLNIVEQSFSTEQFNITFFIYNNTGFGIEFVTLQMWWNGTNVSSAIENLGAGFYLVILTPITVVPGEDPVLLNLTMNANGYEEIYLEINLAVDPEAIKKDTPNSTPPPGIPGYDPFLLIMVLSSAVLVVIIKKTKQK